jgi:hypothetical protein
VDPLLPLGPLATHVKHPAEREEVECKRVCVQASVCTHARTRRAPARVFARAFVYACVTVFKVTRKSIEKERAGQWSWEKTASFLSPP